jgi:phosphoglycerol transferase MdoB-like AlkP superfamily enzyme
MALMILYLGGHMKEHFRFFICLSLFWLLFFVIGRGLFFLYLYPQTRELALSEIMIPFMLGLRMDAAMTGYWMIVTGLLFTFSPLISNRVLSWLQNGFTIFLLLGSSVIIIADLELYKHWGFRINSAPLMYLETEAASSVDPLILILLIVLFALLTGGALLFYIRKLAPWILQLPTVRYPYALGWIVITGLLIIPIRSGFGVAPLNTGMVYFHKTKSFPNHAGINPVWNFLRSVLRDESIKYPENFFTDYRPVFDSLMQTQGETARMINTDKPNIILILLESFTAKIIEPLGGMKDVTPQFSALAKEGILFTHFYASGDRTDKGLVSILSGYPAQPKTSIIKYPHKTQSLPYLTHPLKKSGYHTSFVYGGDVGFANMRSYLTHAGFAHITDADDFDDRLDQSKWGVADHFVFQRLLEECDTAQHPFFKVMLSLSSHEPFEVPMKPVFEGNDERVKFLNACYYTDQSLGEFIRQAKEKSWWTNTLIIITADHGHRFPDPEELKDKARFHIPMLWLGGAVTHRDTVVNTFGVYTDIANTLLNQVANHDSTFLFSKNIFAKQVNSFALYIFNNGYGLISPTHESIYDFDIKNYIRQEGNLRELNSGKAYIQTLFHDYNSR